MKDALKEDADWVDISEKYDAIRLYKLIEKCVLRQTTNKYRYLMLQDEMRSLVTFKQEDGMSSNTFYEKFANRLAIYERVGGVCHAPVLGLLWQVAGAISAFPQYPAGSWLKDSCGKLVEENP